MCRDGDSSKSMEHLPSSFGKGYESVQHIRYDVGAMKWLRVALVLQVPLPGLPSLLISVDYSTAWEAGQPIAQMIQLRPQLAFCGRLYLYSVFSSLPLFSFLSFSPSFYQNFFSPQTFKGLHPSPVGLGLKKLFIALVKNFVLLLGL